MSKSDPSEMSRICLNDDNETLAKKIRKAATDSITGITYDPENRPEVANLLGIYSALSGETIPSICARFENSLNSAFKESLAEIVIQKIGPIREEMTKIRNHAGEVDRILLDGSKRAKEIADNTIQGVKDIVGFI